MKASEATSLVEDFKFSKEQLLEMIFARIKELAKNGYRGVYFGCKSLFPQLDDSMRMSLPLSLFWPGFHEDMIKENPREAKKKEQAIADSFSLHKQEIKDLLTGEEYGYKISSDYLLWPNEEMNKTLTKIDQLQEERRSLRSQLEALKIESSEIYNKQSRSHSELYRLKNLKKKEQSKNHKALISNLEEELQIFNNSEFVQNNVLQLQETRTRFNRCEDELRKYQDEILTYCKTTY